MTPTSTLPITAEGPQLVRRAEELKNIVANKKDLYGDTEAWSSHQELGGLYRRLLLTDLEYALDKKVEQDLWNYCFKAYISHLQSVMRDKKNSSRGEAQMTLTWFLENASGFYILLLEELRQVFGLEIPFLQSSSPYGISDMATKLRPGPEPQKSSCHYVCQHCLVHLGDIARYRSQTRQAETFYRHAISLAPSSGHPYNQIAILEASRGNRLATVYFYVRSVALRNPFPAATTNLSKMLGKLAGLGEQEGDDSVRERTGKVTAHTFIPILLRVHGLLHHAARLKSAVKMSKLLTESLTSLVATESFSTWQMIQMIAVNMWAWQEARAGREHGDPASREEGLVCAVVADIQAAILSAALLPVYTLKQGRQLLDYFALPAVKLLLEWVVSQPDVLRERGMTSRPEIWPSFARILNEIQPLLVDFDPDQLHDYPLPEDYDLQSFRPLKSSLGRYNFKQVSHKPLTDQERLQLLRCCRLTEVGRSLAEMNTPTLKYSPDKGAFVALELDLEPGEDTEILAEQLGEVSEGESEDSEGTPEFEEDISEGKTKGILKNRALKSPILAKKQPVRHNVAMAAILRRAGLENTAPSSPTLSVEDDKDKMVTFKTPSPAASQTSTQDSSSQYSASQEDQAAVPMATSNNNKGKGRRGWSPPPVSRPKANLEDLDFTKPPPSLHSNYRPPALASPPLGKQQHRVTGITSIGEQGGSKGEFGRGESISYHTDVGRSSQGGAVGRAGYGQAVDYGGSQSLSFSGEGMYQSEQPYRPEPDPRMARQETDWWKGNDPSPNSRLNPGFTSGESSLLPGFPSSDANSLLPGYASGDSRRVPGFPPSDSRSFGGFPPTEARSHPGFPGADARPGFPSHESSHLTGFPSLPHPGQGHSPGQGYPQPMQMHRPQGAPPNPLMQLLSASHQGGLSRDTPPGSSPGYALPDLGSLSLSQTWQPSHASKMKDDPQLTASPLTMSPQHKNSPQHSASPQQTYSLFSPTSWPGPLLAQSQGSTPTSANTWAPPQNSSNTPGNMQLFGPGPSPLERLLHQTKNNK